MFSVLRRTPEISVQGVSTPRYAEYIPTLAVPTSLNLIRFLPLAGTGMMIFESKLIFALIDVFFGGNGRHTRIEGRDFTPTENQNFRSQMRKLATGGPQAK